MCATVYGWCHLVKATEVTAGLAENNGSLPPGGWLKVTCGLSACTLRLALGPTLLLFSDLVGLYIVQFYQEFLLLSEKGAKYCDEYACLSVCLSVCTHVAIRGEPLERISDDFMAVYVNTNRTPRI